MCFWGRQSLTKSLFFVFLQPPIRGVKRTVVGDPLNQVLEFIVNVQAKFEAESEKQQHIDFVTQSHYLLTLTPCYGPEWMEGWGKEYERRNSY